MEEIRLQSSFQTSSGMGGLSFWVRKQETQMACTHRPRKVNPLKISLFVTFPEVPHCEEVQGLARELLKINRLLSV